MALTNMGLKRPKLVSFLGGGQNVKEKEKKRGRGRRWRSQDQANKVWNFGFLVWKLTLIMNSMRFVMDLWFCMIIIFPKLGVFLGFHLNPKKVMESKEGKIPYGTR